MSEMEITEAMNLASDMISRAQSGKGAGDILRGFKSYSASKASTMLDQRIADIPNEPKYIGVVEVLEQNITKPGVPEMRDRLYEAYPQLREHKKEESSDLDKPL